MDLSFDTRDDLIAALATLRIQRGMSRTRLGRAAGVKPRDISDYEQGRKVPTRATLERLATALGVRWSLLEALAPVYRRLGLSTTTEAALRAAWVALDLANTADVLTGRPRFPGSPAHDRDDAQRMLWERLYLHGPAIRPAVVEELAEFQTWDFCAFLCEESVRVAPDGALQAVEVAQLALIVAELLPGSEASRARAQGFVCAFLGNALRVSGDLPAADRAFARSAELWQAGARDPGPLVNEVRILDLEASLRREQRRLPEALARLDRAIEADRSGPATGRLLVNRAKTLGELGAYGEAVATLRRAASFVDGSRDPRLLWVLHFNLIENLYYLGGLAEAEAMLPALRELAAQLDHELDLVRLLWLEGRLAAGLGRPEAATAALDRVRAAFADRGIAYDTALVTLELAVLYLEQGRIADVKALASETAWIFQAQGVGRELVATLRLFCEAAEQERVSVELARSCLEAFRHPTPPGAL